MSAAAEFVPSSEQTGTYGECWLVTCESTDTRLYITGPACDEHAPWAIAHHKDPRTQVDPARTINALRFATSARLAGTTND